MLIRKTLKCENVNCETENLDDLSLGIGDKDPIAICTSFRAIRCMAGIENGLFF